MVIYETKMGIVHSKVDGSILAGVFLTSFFVLSLSLQVPPAQQVAAYLHM